MGGFGDLFKAVVSMSRAREVSAMSGDQLKLNAMASPVERSCAGLCWIRRRLVACLSQGVVPSMQGSVQHQAEVQSMTG